MKKEIKLTPQQNEILRVAIKRSGQMLHEAFHLCEVPNEIRSIVNTKDGDYELSFRKKTKS